MPRSSGLQTPSPRRLQGLSRNLLRLQDRQSFNAISLNMAAYLVVNAAYQGPVLSAHDKLLAHEAAKLRQLAEQSALVHLTTFLGLQPTGDVAVDGGPGSFPGPG